MMLGLRRPDAGRASSCGRDPRDPAARRAVGAVLQDVGFPAGLRVHEAVDLVRAHFPDAPSTQADPRAARPRVASRIATRPGSRAVSDGGSPSRSRSRATPRSCSSTSRRPGWTPGRGGCSCATREFAADGGAVLLTTQQLAEAEEIATRVVLLTAAASPRGTVAEIRARGGLTRVTLRARRAPSDRGRAPVDTRGDRHVVYVDDADAFVAELVRSGVPFRELEVAPVTPGGRVRGAHARPRVRLALAHARAETAPRALPGVRSADRRVPRHAPARPGPPVRAGRARHGCSRASPRRRF